MFQVSSFRFNVSGLKFRVVGQPEIRDVKCRMERSFLFQVSCCRNRASDNLKLETRNQYLKPETCLITKEVLTHVDGCTENSLGGR